MDPAERSYIADLYHEYHNKLFLHAYAMLRQHSLAEVAVQEAFRAACQRSGDLLDNKHSLGWMKRAVEHAVLHIKREQRRNATVMLSIEELASGEEPVDTAKDASEVLERCREVVSPAQLEFFLRIAVDGVPFVEEAKRQNITLSACYKRFERIRARLQEALQEYNG